MSVQQIDARKAIYQRFIDDWDETLALPSMDGEPFVPPTEAAWVRLTMRHQASEQKTLGPPNRRWRRVGAIFVQIFIPRDTGTQQIDVIGQAVREMFEGKEIDGVRCYQTTVRELGIDKSWFMAMAETAFDYDEQR